MKETKKVLCDWHREDAKAALHKKGLTLRSLSIKAGYEPDSLKNVLDRRWQNAEKVIAEALEMKPEEIWPSRYQVS